MTLINGYLTLAEFKVRHVIESVDTADDAALDQVIEAASRYMDEQTERTFYPWVDIRYYDVPGGRSLCLDADLVEVLSITNGDGAAIASTEYNFVPKNISPYREIRLTETTAVFWSYTTNSEAAIAVNGIWCYRQRYDIEAWKLGSTLVEASNLNASDLTFTVASGTLFAIGQIIRCENELMIVTGVSTNDITVNARGGNGSTAATHANGTIVNIWQVQASVRQATYEIAMSMYNRFRGENSGAEATILPSGVVVVPRDVPALSWSVIRSYRRIL